MTTINRRLALAIMITAIATVAATTALTTTVQAVKGQEGEEDCHTDGSTNCGGGQEKNSEDGYGCPIKEEGYYNSGGTCIHSD
jgi:hypothetical protein